MTRRYTAVVDDEFQWPREGSDLRDGLVHRDVVDALYAPASLRLDNRAPSSAPTFMAVCAPTHEQRLIVVVCTRGQPDQTRTISGARDATDAGRAMWRKHTS